MACPRQLRNGPCGGSIDRHCEVYPERKCVWVRIHNRVDKNGVSCPELLRAPDPMLFHTSSYVNYFTGKDTPARTPIEYPDLGPNRKAQPAQTGSTLERKLREGRFVFTSEIRAPREAQPDRVQKQALILKDHFDAVNATAYLNGKPSLPSPMASAEMVKLGVEPICQCTCRDHTMTSFISELITNKMNGVSNILCITGDYYQGRPAVKQCYAMDAALMIYEARYLREKGVIHFTGEPMKDPPKPFIAGAINPFTTPINVPIRRLKQKAAAGADFIQTQVVLDLDVFGNFMRIFREEGLDTDLFLLAGLPVIISKKAFEMMPGVPGMLVPKHVTERFEKTQDIVSEGVEFAREMIQEVRQIPGVSGVHLMLFGLDHKVLPAVVHGLREKDEG
jgi:methylenetetrahydrofolate reductase (NADPH)